MKESGNMREGYVRKVEKQVRRRLGQLLVGMGASVCDGSHSASGDIQGCKTAS